MSEIGPLLSGVGRAATAAREDTVEEGGYDDGRRVLMAIMKGWGWGMVEETTKDNWRKRRASHKKSNVEQGPPVASPDKWAHEDATVIDPHCARTATRTIVEELILVPLMLLHDGEPIRERPATACATAAALDTAVSSSRD